MAGILKVDRIQSDSNLSFAVAGANVAYMNTSGIVYGNTTIGNGLITTTGIAFPATQVTSSDANTLDDYEEGTWSPTYLCSGCTFTYAYQRGWYVKIGRFVWIGGTIGVNSSTGTSGNSNSLYLVLPFTSASGQGDEISTLVVGYRNGWTTKYPNAGYTPQGTNISYLCYNPLAGNSEYIQGQHAGTTNYMNFSMAFETNV